MGAIMAIDLTALETEAVPFVEGVAQAIAYYLSGNTVAAGKALIEAGLALVPTKDLVPYLDARAVTVANEAADLAEKAKFGEV
jgi:hypothetical protein